MTYQQMKICVLNLSGNVGKTTLAAHLLGGFRPLAKFISVESINNSDAKKIDSLTIEELKASQFREIYREMMTADDLIVDVGASNVGMFLDELVKYRSAIGEFDLIVIPTVPADKQQKDTIDTIDLLSNLGFPGNKVRVIFNQHLCVDSIDNTYVNVFGYALGAGQNKACWMPAPVVHANEIFEMVKTTRKTVSELAADPTDWKARRNQAKLDKDIPALDLALDGQIAHDLAYAAHANLQQAYADLFAPYESKVKQ